MSMYRKITKQVITTFIISAIPTILSYLANSSLVFDKLIELGYLGKTIDVPTVQDCCLWLGIALSAILLSINLIITKVRYDYVLEQRNALLKMIKNISAGSLGRRFLSESSSFDIRIFVPKHFLLYKIADCLKLKKVRKKFVIKNVDLIAEQGITKDLQFEVSPKAEGLVGACYQRNAMVYDDDLENNNDKNYNLGKNQIAKTSNLKWSICCPICDDNDVVVAIVALDGKTRITIDSKKEAALKEEFVTFSRMLYDSVPQLFRR